MQLARVRKSIYIIIVFGIVSTSLSLPVGLVVKAQQGMDPSPTVSETPSRSVLTVITSTEPFVNVRSGPSTVDYPIIGKVYPGDQVVALGASPGREWIEIEFNSGQGRVGWVYSLYLSQPSVSLSVVEPPPTAKPETTPTIDPTLAAAYNIQPTSTHLPTFTPPPPLVVPTYTSPSGIETNRTPMGMIVLGLGIIGLLGVLVSFLNRR